MKKRVLSLLVLIGCVSIYCLRFRKKADCLQWGKGKFIKAEYWTQNFETVRSVMPNAEVYVFEEYGEIQGFCRNGCRIHCRIICSGRTSGAWDWSSTDIRGKEEKSPVAACLWKECRRGGILSGRRIPYWKQYDRERDWGTGVPEGVSWERWIKRILQQMIKKSERGRFEDAD